MLTVFLDLQDLTVRMALAFAVDEAGWVRSPVAAAGAVHVGDRVLAEPAPPLDVLVTTTSPAACRRAVDAFAAGSVRAVLRATDPSGLPAVLHLARRGLGVVPAAVVEAARGFPVLPPRLERTLGLVLRGWSNQVIARHLHQSEATTKRDVADLLRRFDAPNRVALAAAAIRLGVHPAGGS